MKSIKKAGGQFVNIETGEIVRREFISREKRAFTAEKRKKTKRTSPVTQNFHDKNLGSEIKPKAGSPETAKLIKTHKRERFQGEHLTAYGIKFIQTITSQFKLPKSLLYRAIRLFKEVTKTGQRIETSALACVSLASEEARIPVSSGELSEFGVKRKKISKAKRKFIRELDLDTAPLGAEDYVNKILTKLDKMDWRDEVLELIDGVRAGGNPLATVGGAVWYLSKNNGREVSRNEIAEVCGTTDVTIQNHARKLS